MPMIITTTTYTNGGPEKSTRGGPVPNERKCVLEDQKSCVGMIEKEVMSNGRSRE